MDLIGDQLHRLPVGETSGKSCLILPVRSVRLEASLYEEVVGRDNGGIYEKVELR